MYTTLFAIIRILLILLTFCNAQLEMRLVKYVVLTPNNVNEDGANISVVHETDVVQTGSKWNIMSTNQVGFHLKISLDETWGFMDSETVISVAIYSDDDGPLFTGDILTCFSVNNTQYITTVLHMNNVQNQIWPIPAGYSKQNSYDPYKRPAYGDIQSLVNEAQNNKSRIQKAIANNSIVDLPFMTDMSNNDNGYNNSWPLFLRVLNYPEPDDDLVLDVINTEWPFGLHQHNSFIDAFPLYQGLDIYFAVANNGESLNITKVLVYMQYLSTSPPTIEPTADPTNNPTVVSDDPTTSPTGDPTIDPTNDPTTDPTADPTTDPTADPTTDPTADPTSDPTTNPINVPTTNPTNDPTNDPTHLPTTAPTTSNNILYGIDITITFEIEVVDSEQPTDIEDIIPGILEDIIAEETTVMDHCDSEYNIKVQENAETITVNGTIFVCNQNIQQILIAYLSDEIVLKTEFISSVNSQNETNLIALTNGFKLIVEPITIYIDDIISTFTTNATTLSESKLANDSWFTFGSDFNVDLCFILIIIICIALIIFITDFIYIKRFDFIHLKNILWFALSICNLITDAIISYQLSSHYHKPDHDISVLIIAIAANVSLVIPYVYNTILGTLRVYIIRSHICCLFSYLLAIITGDVYITLTLLTSNIFNTNTINTVNKFKIRNVKSITMMIYNIPQMILQSLYMALILQSLDVLYIVSIALSLINVIPYVSLIYLCMKSFRFVIVDYALRIIALDTIPQNTNTASNLYLLTKRFSDILDINASEIQITGTDASKIAITQQIDKRYRFIINKYIQRLYKHKKYAINRCIENTYALHSEIKTELQFNKYNHNTNTPSTVASTELQRIPGRISIQTHSNHVNDVHHDVTDRENEELYDIPKHKYTGTPITPIVPGALEDDEDVILEKIMYRIVSQDEHRDLPPSPNRTPSLRSEQRDGRNIETDGNETKGNGNEGVSGTSNQDEKKDGLLDDILSDVFQMKSLSEKKMNQMNMNKKNNDPDSDDSDNMYEKQHHNDANVVVGNVVDSDGK